MSLERKTLGGVMNKKLLKQLKALDKKIDRLERNLQRAACIRAYFQSKLSSDPAYIAYMAENYP
jgi:phosphate uptake regulator